VLSAPRLLCINPNTSSAITAQVASALLRFLPEGTQLEAATGAFGAPYIASRATYAIGGHAALDCLIRHAETPYDAVLLACFGDPALLALREVAAVPVIGMAEAACCAAAREAGRFSIVTGGHGWQEMLGEFVAGLGLSERLASIRTTTLSGGEIAQNPEAGMPHLVSAIAACADDGAARVILGGAGLAGLAARLAPLSPLPVIDCVASMAEAALAAIHEAHAQGLHARPSPQAKRLAASLLPQR